MTKYDIDDDHEWADEKAAKEQQEQWRDLAGLSSHTVEVLYDVEQEYQSAEKFACEITHQGDTPTVLYAATFKNKGNYWRKLDMDDWLDFQDLPMPARVRVAEVLNRSVSEITPDERLVNPDHD